MCGTETSSYTKQNATARRDFVQTVISTDLSPSTLFLPSVVSSAPCRREDGGGAGPLAIGCRMPTCAARAQSNLWTRWSEDRLENPCPDTMAASVLKDRGEGCLRICRPPRRETNVTRAAMLPPSHLHGQSFFPHDQRSMMTRYPMDGLDGDAPRISTLPRTPSRAPSAPAGLDCSIRLSRDRPPATEPARPCSLPKLSRETLQRGAFENLF